MPSALSPRIIARNSWVECGSRVAVGSSRIAMLRVFHQDLGEAEPLAHAARKRRQPGRGRHRASPTRIIALSKRSSISRRGRPGKPPGIGEIIARREAVVKADRIGQVADPALDFERLAQRVEAGNLGAAFAGFGQAEQHQDRRRLAGAVRPENADDLAGADFEIDMIDGENVRRSVWSAPRRGSRCRGHRRLPSAGRSGRRQRRRPGGRRR